MRPLSRNNPDTRSQALTRRVEALERRIIPDGWLPFAQAQTTAHSMNPNSSVQPGFTFANTTDPHYFSHIPVVNAWNPNVSNNVDGSLLILQPGHYIMWATVNWGTAQPPAATQLSQIQFVSCAIDVDSSPIQPAPFAAFGAGGTGSVNAIVSAAVGSNAEGTAGEQWAYQEIITGVSPSSSDFKPFAVKLRLLLSTGASTPTPSCSVTVVQTSARPFNGPCLIDIQDAGIPSDWTDDSEC